MTLDDMQTFIDAYLECALWSSTGPAFTQCPDCKKVALLHKQNEDREACCEACGTCDSNHEPPLDDNYSTGDFTKEALAECKQDCIDFVVANITALADYPAINAGHDFWLTRNGHGAGFWENDYGTKEQCKLLTTASKVYGTVNIMPDSEGKLHV